MSKSPIRDFLAFTGWLTLFSLIGLGLIFLLALVGFFKGMAEWMGGVVGLVIGCLAIIASGFMMSRSR